MVRLRLLRLVRLRLLLVYVMREVRGVCVVLRELLRCTLLGMLRRVGCLRRRMLLLLLVCVLRRRMRVRHERCMRRWIGSLVVGLAWLQLRLGLLRLL